MNNKFGKALVLLFIVGIFLVMIGSVNAYTDDLNQTAEVSGVDNALSISGSSDGIAINDLDEQTDSSQEASNGLNSEIVSIAANTPQSVENDQDVLSDPEFIIEQRALTPVVLMGDYVVFEYFVNYTGSGELSGDDLAVTIYYGANEMDYISFDPQSNPNTGEDDSSSFSMPVNNPGYIVVTYDGTKFKSTKSFKFNLKFKAKDKGDGGIGTHAVLTDGVYATQKSLALFLNLTKTSNEKMVRYNLGDIIEFNVCLDNNKLYTYFGDYRQIILIQDFYPDGLEYEGYTINPDKNGNIPLDSKFIHIGKVDATDPSGPHVEIKYNASGGWLPDSFLNVTLKFRATKYGIQCNHIRTWWQDGTEYWAQASVCVGKPDLNLTKTVREEEVPLDGDVYFDIFVENNGTVDYYDHYLYPRYLVVEDYYPDGLEYLDYDINPDKNGEDWLGDAFFIVDTNFDGNHIRLVFESGDAWVPGSSMNVTLHFKARQVGTFVNKANVYWRWRDWDDHPEEIDLWDNATVRVGLPNFTLEKISNYGKVEVGDMVGFTIIYTNTGYCNLTGVYITDNEYTQGLVYSDYSDKETWEFDGTDTWYYNGVLAPGESAILELTFKTTSVGFKTNTAVAGNNVTDYTLNSTDNVTVIDKNNETDTAEDDDDEYDPDIPDEDDQTDVPDKHTPPVSKVIDSKATGNPLLVLLLCLIAMCSTQFKRKK